MPVLEPSHVAPGQRAATMFTLAQRTHIARITTYHWNGGRGAPPGTMALRGADGRTYGPFSARGDGGASGAKDLYWVAQPRITLEPGTYTVVDSDPATWAHNAESGHQGMAKVEGFAEVRPAR